MNYNVLRENEINKTPFTRIIISKTCSHHYHSFFEFTICTKGNYINVINDNKINIEKGRVILLRPQDRHYFVADGNHVFRDIYVPIPIMKAVCNAIDPTLYQRVLNTPLLVDFSVYDFQLQMLENKLNYLNVPANKPDLSLNTRHRSVITELFDLWLQNSELKSNNLPDWLSLLLTQLGTERFINKNIEDIIASTNYSHGYVCREFKKYIGKTLQDYLMESRFSYALSLLAGNKVTVAQVAEKLGYSAATNFIIAFKSKFGVTPTQWRKSSY